jgi:outer membrane protein assembly factor BamD
MTKKFLVILAASFIIAGCSSSKNTANMSPKEHLDYAMQLYNQEDYQDALTEFQTLVLQYPGDAIADDAEYYLGMTQFKRQQYILAAYEFSKLIKNMPASDYVPKAQYMLADCYYELSPDYTLDQEYTKKAIQEFQAFIDFYPTNEQVKDAEAKIQELNDKLAHKEFHSGEIYGKMDYYDAALIYYNNVIDTYHDTKYAAMAAYNKIQVLMEMKKPGDALTEVDEFLDKYPNNENIPVVRKLKASLENKLSSSE